VNPTPERPYVPHRTPTRAQPAVLFADFTLARPFVPGAEQVRSPAPQAPAVVSGDENQRGGMSETSLPSVESFLESPRPSVPSQPVDAFEIETDGDPEELPPLEHFLDPLPAISDFAADENDAYAANADFSDSPVISDPAPVAADADWGETDWQRYDWQSVAALGDTEKAQADASNAWATTDWEVPTPRKDERSATPSDAIATALDRIAERLRNGDFVVPGASGIADPATIAATLAALLGVRR
jgi:hypothetical protein